jgi:hypothetical protein
MPRRQRVDFFEEIQRIEEVLAEVAEAEQDAFRRLICARPGPAQGAAMNAYRRAAAMQKKAVDRRQRFLDKNRP